MSKVVLEVLNDELRLVNAKTTNMVTIFEKFYIRKVPHAYNSGTMFLPETLIALNIVGMYFPD